MNARTHKVHPAITLARIAALVIVFVLGHDVMMTMLPHHAAAESAHHQVIEVQECGSTEGMVHPHPGPVFDQLVVNLIPAGLTQHLDTGATHAPEQVYILSDASARRAWLQVFLN